MFECDDVSTKGDIMKKLLIATLTLANVTAYASPLSEKALTFVPGGTVVQEKIKEVKVKTPKSSIVEIEFHSDGSFEEASGSNLDKDILIPKEGLLPLSSIVEQLVKQGKTPTGDWSLEKSLLDGWHYEFEGFENGQKFDYLVDAKNGKLLESKIDD